MALGNPLPSPAFQLAVADLIPAGNPIAPPTGFAGVLSQTGGALAAGTYYYSIASVNLTGDGVLSPEIGPFVVTSSAGSIQFTWNGVAGATNYKLWRRLAGAAYNAQEVLPATPTSFLETGATSFSGPPSVVPTWQVVSLLNSWDADYNEQVSEYDVFGLADPIEVNGRAKSTMSFGGFLPDSTDSGSTLISNHEAAKDFLLVRVLWDGTNGFFCRARVQTKKISAKAGANLIEVTYTFVVLPSSFTLIGNGPLL